MSCFCASTHTHTFKHRKNDRLSRCFLRLRSHIILPQHELYLAHYSVFILKIPNATSLEHGERVSSELSILSPMILFFPQCEYNSSGTKKSRDVQLSINAFDIRQKPTFCAVAQFTQTRTRLYPEPIVSLAPPSPARLSTKFDTFSFLYRCIMCALAIFSTLLFFGLPSILSIVCLFFRASH